MRRFQLLLVSLLLVAGGCRGANGELSLRGSRDGAGSRTAPPSAEVWSPGDDIPGWDDFDCGELSVGAGYVVSEMPEVLEAGLQRYGGKDGDYAYFVVADCGGDACSDGGEFPAGNGPSAYLDTQARVGLVDERGQGVFGPFATHSDSNAFGLNGRTAIGDFCNDDDRVYTDNVDATFCLYRVRPDMIQGVVRIEPWLRPIESPWYSSVVVLIPVTVNFADHAGVDGRYPGDTGEPAGTADVHYSYHSGYDDAWPWDEITDPAIRAAVYDRYLPWNTP